MSGATGVMAGAAIAGAATSAYSASQQSSAQKKAAAAAANSKVDINALDAQTRNIARQNALDSAALEKQLTPEVPQLRTAANTAVLNGIGNANNPAQQQAMDALGQRMGQPVSNASFLANTPLLNQAIAKVQSDLALGGQLSVDQRNEATRRGAAMAGSVGGSAGLGLGRDLSARDLGLTSYNVEQQRLQNAGQFGQLELGRENLGLGAATLGLNRDVANNSGFLNQFSLLNSYYNNLRQQDLAAAQYGNSIQSPVTGLDPSAVANLTVGNMNNQTQGALNAAGIQAKNGQNLMGFGGQLLGYGLNQYANSNSNNGSVPNSYIGNNPYFQPSGQNLAGGT